MNYSFAIFIFSGLAIVGLISWRFYLIRDLGIQEVYRSLQRSGPFLEDFRDVGIFISTIFKFAVFVLRRFLSFSFCLIRALLRRGQSYFQRFSQRMNGRRKLQDNHQMSDYWRGLNECKNNCQSGSRRRGGSGVGNTKEPR
jgi:hypothetical protein